MISTFMFGDLVLVSVSAYQKQVEVIGIIVIV